MIRILLKYMRSITSNIYILFLVYVSMYITSQFKIHIASKKHLSYSSFKLNMFSWFLSMFVYNLHFMMCALWHLCDICSVITADSIECTCFMPRNNILCNMLLPKILVHFLLLIRSCTSYHPTYFKCSVKSWVSEMQSYCWGIGFKCWTILYFYTM